MAKTRKQKTMKISLHISQIFEISGMDFTITMTNVWKKIGERWRISPDKLTLKNQMDIPNVLVQQKVSKRKKLEINTEEE